MNWQPGERQHIYELTEPIAGTDAKLWRARHLLNQSSVIVKRIDEAERRALWQLFSRKITSPRLIAFLDLHDSFAVMEDGGETLAARIKRGIGEGERIPIVVGIFEALNDLHQAGLIHGDLKPLNILVAPNDRKDVAGSLRIRLIDFGLTAAISADEMHHTLGRTDALTGTPAYLDPMLAEGKPLGPKSDLFAAGLIAFEILNGRRPAYGESLPNWIQRCIGRWDARFIDAREVLTAFYKEFVTPDELARLAPAAGAESRPEIVLRERLFGIVDELHGNVALNGPAFVEMVANLRAEGSVDPTLSIDRVRVLLSQETDRWRMASERQLKPAPAASTAPAKSTAPTAGETPDGPTVIGTLPATGNAVLSAVFMPDGMWIVTGNADQKLRAWRLDYGDKNWHARGIDFPRPHWDRVNGVATAPDGKWILSGSGDRTARVWRLHSNSEQISEAATLRGHSDGINAVAFAPIGNFALTASADRTAKLWRLTFGHTSAEAEELATFGEHSKAVNDVRFAPGGKWAATASDDGTAIMWYFTRPPSKGTAAGQSGRQAAPNANANSSGASGGIRARSIGVLTGHYGPMTALAFASTGKLLVTGGGDGRLCLWYIRLEKDDFERQLIREINAHKAGITSVDCAPNGKWLLSGSLDGTAKLWAVNIDDAVPSLFATLDAGDRVTAVNFSPDGRWALTALTNGQTKIWRLFD